MNQLLLLCFSSTVLFSLSSCRKIVGEGPVVTENRTVQPFTGIILKVPGSLYYTQNPIYGLELRSQRNILNEIETVINGTNLEIRFKHHNTSIGRHDVINVYVSSPDANNLEIKGSGNLYITQPFTGNRMRLATDGSGNIQVNQLTVNSLTSTISGTGNVMVNMGTVEMSEANISGSGFIDVSGLTAQKGKADISGSGTIKISATQQLDAHISGSGTIWYKGSPVVNSSISGSGSVKKL